MSAQFVQQLAADSPSRITTLVATRAGLAAMPPERLAFIERIALNPSAQIAAPSGPPHGVRGMGEV
jgi:hypothetical protein